MQLTLRVRVPSEVTVRDERLAKRIESFVIKEIHSKFGKQVDISKKPKTKRQLKKRRIVRRRRR